MTTFKVGQLIRLKEIEYFPYATTTAQEMGLRNYVEESCPNKEDLYRIIVVHRIADVNYRRLAIENIKTHQAFIISPDSAIPIQTLREAME